MTLTTVLRLWPVVCLAACSGTAPKEDLIFVDGRAVAAAGDSLLAMTRQGSSAITVRDRITGEISVHAAADLRTPLHIQESGGLWYVSDVVDGEAIIVVFSADWEVRDRIGVDSVAAVPHQFAVLPDGTLVLESVDGRLLALRDDSLTTFALTEQSSRNGMLVAAQGGVLHTIPDKTLTLYNARGNLRWRQAWPWHEGAYIADLSVDANGRVHVLAGAEGTNVFYAFTLSPVTGEAVRWTAPSLMATFVVKQLGEIRPDSTERWIGGP